MREVHSTLEQRLPLFYFTKQKEKQKAPVDACNFFSSQKIEERLFHYDMDSYLEDVRTVGLVETWDAICAYLLNGGKINKFLNITSLGELYEIGLAIQNKTQKKEKGQYYTPGDMADVMVKWFHTCCGENVCDVACGTGKLILAYLDYIGYKKASDLINSGHLYLYDIDSTALKICKTSIIIKYSIANSGNIHEICGDFLNDEIALPKNSRVIANPPYGTIRQFGYNWKSTEVLSDTKELYAAFMEKIFTQANSSVIITPFSFVSGKKFYSLRKKMTSIGNGFIISFDNVPGNIFCGKKHGVFNTNISNSVRASVTMLNRSVNVKGFRVSPLIRFKNVERSKLLVNEILESQLPETFQIIDTINTSFKKIDKSLYQIYEMWSRKSTYTLKDVLSNNDEGYLINVPNTCRYFTTASCKKLKRTGVISLYIKDKRYFSFVYCFINSSFAYWWWRIFDGGITYPKSLLETMPLPLNLLTVEDFCFFECICNNMIQIEENCVVTKVNAGELQENIKFPLAYREKINKRLLSILNCRKKIKAFSSIHANKFF